MRYLLTLFAAFVFAACGTTSVTSDQPKPITSNQTQVVSPTEVPVPDAKTASADEIKEYLLTSAADDFHMTIKTGPVSVRDVRFGHTKNSDGTNQYRLCGEYLEEKKDTKAEWTHFVTLMTVRYEQYIGAMSASWCKKESVIWDKEGDLSAILQRRLDAHK